MQQRGSKYDQKIKDEALALIASGVKISNASVRLGIPKSTLSDWVHTQNESDEDGVAARRRTPGPSMTVWQCLKKRPRTA